MCAKRGKILCRFGLSSYFCLYQVQVLLSSAGKGMVFSLETKKSPQKDEFTPEEIATIQRGLDDIENGRTHRTLEGESFDDFLIRIEPCLK